MMSTLFRGCWHKLVHGALLVAILTPHAALVRSASAAPPDYTSFGRDQRLQHTPDEDDLLRIWVVYVGQGDGILIQFPRKYQYDVEDTDPDIDAIEQLDILIDGGSFRTADAGRMLDFIETLYAPVAPVVEYAVLTHHDADHTRGLARVLESDSVDVEHVFHNGLASYRPGSRGFPASGVPQNKAVYARRNGLVTRGMAFLAPGAANLTQDDSLLRSLDLVPNLATLRERSVAGQLHGVYDDLGDAVIESAGPGNRTQFDRAMVGTALRAGARSHARSGRCDRRHRGGAVVAAGGPS